MLWLIVSKLACLVQSVQLNSSTKFCGCNLYFHSVYFLSPSEGSSTSWMVGSTVTLHCSNKSISDLVQLTWRRNGTCLFSFRPRKTSNSSSVTLSSNQKTPDSRIRMFPPAAPLNLNMSTLESQLYALIIERAQKSHTGNYTCETTTDFGVFEQKWELVITGEFINFWSFQITKTKQNITVTHLS